MPAHDAIIVGGGPAGSSCARELVAAGLDVVVIDRAEFPRDKVCAGWVTPQLVETIGLDLADYRAHRTCQPITSFSTGVLGGRQLITRYDRAISYGILRSEFDWYLLERSGARLETNTPIASLERKADAWIVNERHRAPLLVGAGGHFCPVARRLDRPRRPSAPIVAAQEVEFPLDGSVETGFPIAPETPELFFWPDLQGYCWCFRKGRHLNIGVGRIGGKRLGDHVGRFIAFLRQSGKIPPGLPARWKGHAYALYGSATRPLVADGTILVGDAAGLAYPQSGEGIRTAVESGVLAARAAIAAAGRVSAEALEPYHLMIRERFGDPPHEPSSAPWLPASLLSAVGTRLLATRWFSRHVVLDRWFLHTSQPALAATSLGD